MHASPPPPLAPGAAACWSRGHAMACRNSLQIALYKLFNLDLGPAASTDFAVLQKLQFPCFGKEVVACSM
jgi:hypothetical protein